MPSTILQIAQLLGVSKTTVHRALNNTGRINAETKKEILNLAKELDYRPNNIARSLRSKRSMTIGLVLRGIMVGHYYSEILSGIEEIASQAGYVINIACSCDDVKKEQNIISNFCCRRVDGVIIAPVIGSNISNYQQLRNDDIPFVFIDKYVGGVEADVVTADSRSGVKAAIGYLSKAGYDRIAFLDGYEGGSVTLVDRVSAYLEQLDEEKQAYHNVIESNRFGTEDKLCGYAAIKHYLGETSKNDIMNAIICANDSIAFGALKAIREAGLSVPGDIALVGNNNDSMTEYVSPMLTTISQPKYEMGQIAMRTLLNRIDQVGDECYSFTKLPVSLLLRDST